MLIGSPTKKVFGFDVFEISRANLIKGITDLQKNIIKLLDQVSKKKS